MQMHVTEIAMILTAFSSLSPEPISLYAIKRNKT